MTRSELEGLLAPTETKVWFAVSNEKEPDGFTKIIQKFQGTKYSHALVIYYSLDLGDYVIGNARGKAAQLDSIEDLYSLGDEIHILFEKQINGAKRTRFIKEIIHLDGINYSETQIFNIGIEAIFGYRAKSNGIDGIICSEYADRLAQTVGLKSAADILDKPIDLINPKDNVTVWDSLTASDPTFNRVS